MGRTSGLLKAYKEAVHCLYENGKVLDTPRGRYMNKNLDSDTIDVLRELVRLVIDNKMVTLETRLYISDIYITYKGVADKIQSLTGELPNVNTVQSKIWSDKNKLVRYFGENVFLDLIEYNDKEKLPEYREKIMYAYQKYGNDKVLNNLGINIPKCAMVSEVNQDDFNDFISAIGPYTKAHMKFVEDNLDRDVAGYCRYILSSSNLTDKDKENKQIIMDMIGGC